MARELFKNNAQTTLNGAINNSVTSIVVTTGSVFPSDNFRIIIESEIMFCTSRSSNTLTVIRGVESTAAASHADALDVKHILTADSFNGLRLNILADCNLVPRTASISTDDDEFDDQSFTSWTTVQGTPNATLSEDAHRFNCVIPASSASAQYYAFMKNKTPGTGDYIQVGFQEGGLAGQFPQVVLFMADGGTYNAGNQAQFGFSVEESLYFTRSQTGYNTAGTATTATGRNYYKHPAYHLRFTYKGSHQYDGHIGIDGVNWNPMFTNVTIGSFTPTWMGFGFTSWGSAFPHHFQALYARFSF